MLKYVKTTKCPICGCEEIVREEVGTMNGQISYHCNGTRWETRGFACGYIVRYVPNFCAEEVVGKCLKTKEKENNEHNKIIDKLISYLNSIECSDKIKINIKESLNKGRKYY